MAPSNNHTLVSGADLARALHMLNELEATAAPLRKLVADYALRHQVTEAGRKPEGVSSHRRRSLDASLEAVRRRARHAGPPDGSRLQTDSDDLRTVAQRAGVDYSALADFVRSEEVSTFAWEFTHDAFNIGNRDKDCWNPDAANWTLDTWCALFKQDERLLRLRYCVAEASYAGDFDPSPWFFDGPLVDKRHFTMADHITRFVLLCEHFRLVDGRAEWANDRFAKPHARLCMYKCILLLFTKHAEEQMAVDEAAFRSAVDREDEGDSEEEEDSEGDSEEEDDTDSGEERYDPMIQ